MYKKLGLKRWPALVYTVFIFFQNSSCKVNKAQSNGGVKNKLEKNK
jgi:hypothetical protein